MLGRHLHLYYYQDKIAFALGYTVQQCSPCHYETVPYPASVVSTRIDQLALKATWLSAPIRLMLMMITQHNVQIMNEILLKIKLHSSTNNLFCRYLSYIALM